jgi:murein DD-endopeptidase MepM/ murein hydrolase activator NlpD
MDILSTILNFIKPISKKLFNESASNWWNPEETETRAAQITTVQADKLREVSNRLEPVKEKPVWRYPVENRTVTSPYGWRMLQGQRTFHNGTDFTGRNIEAVAPVDIIIKKVLMPDNEYPVKFRYNSAIGSFEPVPGIPEGRAWTPYIVAVSAEDSTIRFVYRHVRASVPVGARVNAGGSVCRIGNWGYSMGAHLHFEIQIFKNNQWVNVDPVRVLDEKIREQEKNKAA